MGEDGLDEVTAASAAQTPIQAHSRGDHPLSVRARIPRAKRAGLLPENLKGR